MFDCKQTAKHIKNFPENFRLTTKNILYLFHKSNKKYSF